MRSSTSSEASGASRVVPTDAPLGRHGRSVVAAALVSGVIACGGGGTETAANPAPAPVPVPVPAPTPAPPAAPTVDAVESDDIVSAAEASDGVTLSGQSEPNSLVSVNWSGAAKQISSAGNGTWSVSYAQGELPAAGTTLISVTTSNANGTSQPTQRQVVIESAPTGPVRMMALGDSMLKGDENDTAGLSCTSVFPNTSWRSFRGNLQQRLSNAGYSQEWLGSQTLTPASGGSDPDHEGYAGIFIGPIQPGDAVRGTPAEQASCRSRSTTPTSDGTGNGNLLDRLPSILGSGTDPDVIVFFGGWNSVYCDSASNAVDTSTSADQMTALVDDIQSRKPNAKLVLTTLTPQRNQTEAGTNATIGGYAQLNQRMRDLAAARPNVYLADAAALSLGATEYWDIIHWCQPAADKVGQAIFDVIQTNDLMRP